MSPPRSTLRRLGSRVRIRPGVWACRGGYTIGMKTAISLPDDLFASADDFAERASLSRSELYARAIREYLQRHDQDKVTAQLDALCAELDTRLAPELARATRRVLERDEW